MVSVTWPVILQQQGRGSQQHWWHPAPAAHAALEAQQTGLMLANISFLYILIAYSETDVSEEEEEEGG